MAREFDDHSVHSSGPGDRVVLQARNVSFDWASLPLHYVDGDPLATHLVNVMHLLLP
ncbi:MAG: metal-dependent hydrolase, partial [Rhodococcus sp. (in: high G+C Gram-positive bacteria)]